MGKVLIVDDSRTSRKMLRTIIEEAGHSVVGEAVNGEEGVRLYKELSPDAVTMDITMPVMDGMEAMREILAEDEEAKIIMVTAVGQKHKVVEAIRDGACDYVIKPYSASDVSDVVKKVLDRAQ